MAHSPHLFEIKTTRDFPVPKVLYYVSHVIFLGIALMLVGTPLKEVGEYPLLWLAYPGSLLPNAFLMFARKRFAQAGASIDENHILTITYPLMTKKIPIEQIKSLKLQQIRAANGLRFSNYLLLDANNQTLGLFNAGLYSRNQMLELGHVLESQIKEFKLEL
jgi:hypothetical protein